MVNHANKVKQQHGHIGEGHQNLPNNLIKERSFQAFWA